MTAWDPSHESVISERDEQKGNHNFTFSIFWSYC